MIAVRSISPSWRFPETKASSSKNSFGITRDCHVSKWTISTSIDFKLLLPLGMTREDLRMLLQQNVWTRKVMVNEDVSHVPLQTSCDLGGFHGSNEFYNNQKVSLPNQHLDLHLLWASGNALSFFDHRGRSTQCPSPDPPTTMGKLKKSRATNSSRNLVPTNWNFMFRVILCLVITPVKQFLVLHLLPHLENQTSTYGLIIKIIFFGKLYCLGGWNPVTNNTFPRRSVLTFTFELLLGGEAFQAISVVWELGKSWKHWTFTIWESWKHISPIKSITTCLIHVAGCETIQQFSIPKEEFLLQLVIFQFL